MTAEDEFAKELAKQLPIKTIYEDAGAPAAKQAGQLLADLVKNLQLALFPVQFLAALQDRYRTFLDRSVRRVPTERQIAPPPQILGPILEGIRYEPEGTPIDEMFSQLLSASMDQERVSEAHPSFPLIVKQLSSDEAKILKALFTAPQQLRLVQTRRLGVGAEAGINFPDKTETDELPKDKLIFPENVSLYREHLHQLGLLIYDTYRAGEPIMTAGTQTGFRTFLKYRLSELGQKFMRACSGAD